MRIIKTTRKQRHLYLRQVKEKYFAAYQDFKTYEYGVCLMCVAHNGNCYNCPLDNRNMFPCNSNQGDDKMTNSHLATMILNGDDPYIRNPASKSQIKNRLIWLMNEIDENTDFKISKKVDIENMRFVDKRIGFVVTIEKFVRGCND